jgi:hypothetical protein
MPSLFVDIKITAEEYLKSYQAANAVVTTHSRCGRSVQFPANILQPYVSHSGIQGSFQIEFDQSGKFKAVKKIA